MGTSEKSSLRTSENIHSTARVNKPVYLSKHLLATVSSHKYHPFGGCADAPKPLRCSSELGERRIMMWAHSRAPKSHNMAGEAENKLREWTGID
jgi:hypothetical protein